MGRLLMLVAVVAAIYLLLSRFVRVSAYKKRGETGAEDMVKCHYCGVHLPKSEGIENSNDWYCNESHMRASQANK